jgi:outer membrane biosynthesis protein TonB
LAQDVARHAKTPPDVAEEATISLTPAQERECGGKVVGVSLVVGEDGSLKSKRVISGASAFCDAIALEAVTRNRYKAALDERRRPVEGRFLLSIRF